MHKRMILLKIQRFWNIMFYFGKYHVLKNCMFFENNNAYCKPFPLSCLKYKETDNKLIKSILNGNVLLFGNLYPIDATKWNYDPEHGYDYGRHFYQIYKLPSYERNKDPKFVLELSRLNHIFYIWSIGRMTNNQKMLIFAYEKLEEWNSLHPIGMGMGWSCTMDVALRAINLVVIYSNDRNSYCKYLRKIIWNHHIFIQDNLENRGINNNHYFTNIVGLIFTSIALNDSPIFDFAMKELEKELNNQILNDGVDFEGSTAYHRFIFQLVIYVIVFLKVNNLKPPKIFIEKASHMLFFINSIASNNQIPLFGDCDSSFVLNMDDYETGDVRNIKSINEIIKSNILFKDIDYNYSQLHFRKSGYYILKNEVWKAVIKCGKVRGTGGHYHNDQLSYVLYLNGEEFFVDRGLYTYYGNYKIRNICRSTASHNCYSLNQVEQNSFVEDEIFIMESKYSSEVLEAEEDRFKGKFFGYNNECEFYRECRITSEKFEEYSTYTKNGGEINYYLAPRCEVEILSPNSIKVTGKTFAALIKTSEKFKIIKKSCYTAYMQAEYCNVIKICPQSCAFKLEIIKVKNS